MNFKKEKGDVSEGIIILFLIIVVLFVLFGLGFWLWNYVHQSIWHAVIFWLCAAVIIAIALVIKFWDDILFEIEWRFRERNNVTGNQSEMWHYSNTVSASPYKESTLEDSILEHIRQFKPRWIERNGRHRLEGGENGNNANLAQYLRDNGISDVETEVTLKNGSRADILINKDIIIECKPHLLSVEKLHSLSGEIRRVKRIGNYNKLYALIYGDAKSYLLDDLKADIGENNVVVLGEVNHD
jgi:hypothetical protein